MFIPTKDILKRTLLMSIVGTRGGVVRLKILLLLESTSHNINELSKILSLDYKSVQHHIRVLEKSGLITPSGKKYANAYRLSSLLEAHKDVLRELKNMGKSKYS